MPDPSRMDVAVKLKIYDTFAATARAPSAAEIATALGFSVEAVTAACDRLHQKRLLAPEPGDPSRIRMAPPFSAIETPFRVTVEGRAYFANCIWDAYGISAALHKDAAIEASDGHTGESITLDVREGRPVPQACVVHFAVPAARWWADIIHT